MRTVKDVAMLTGVSVRTLQYYDEIGVLKPAKVTDAGYRLYDDESLNALQQILFFKELDFPLKDIKAIMETPGFDKIEAFRKQKTLLKAKRDRLNRLLTLLDKLEQGESCMSFKEFDLSEYVEALEEFRDYNTEEVIRHWGSTEAFNSFIERVKNHESDIAQSAVEYYGSVEKYVAAMKDNLSHFSENMEKMERIKEKGYVERNTYLMEQLMKDISRDVTSGEVQELIGEMMNLLETDDQPVMDLGEHYWDNMADGYLHNQALIDIMDKKYGVGASRFMGGALRCYLDSHSV